MFSKILSSALELWLRSQVEQVEDLQLKIFSSDRQLLGGYIPSIDLSSGYAIYQGLHFGKIQLKGENIQINLGQISQGKPFSLLKPVAVTGEVCLEESHLQASLSAPLLSIALSDLLVTLLPIPDNEKLISHLGSLPLIWRNVKIKRDQLSLQGYLANTFQPSILLYLKIGLTLENSHQLRLSPIIIETPLDLPIRSVETWDIDLGPQVNLQELTLVPGHLRCRGTLQLIPK